MRAGALGLLLALPCAAAAVRDDLGKLLGSARASLEIRLPRFDDAALQHDVLLALSRGARVRLILNRREKASRLAALQLRGAGVQVRWASQGKSRFLVADKTQVGLGNVDGHAAALDGGRAGLAVISDSGLAAEFAAQFEKEWAGLTEALPSEMALKDELEALPDPRENEPRVRVKRRRN